MAKYKIKYYDYIVREVEAENEQEAFKEREYGKRIDDGEVWEITKVDE